jgi:oligopeptide/dipeptide ABC transporter ATP-binding protein
MYLGEVVEEGTAESFDRHPLHPYTEALFSATPVPDPTAHSARIRLSGQLSESDKHGPGCIFSARCPRRKGAVCYEKKPGWHTLGSRRYSCHWKPAELAALQGDQTIASVQSLREADRANAGADYADSIY